MTIIACPHGCGGFVDTAKDDGCPSCRRGLNETEVLIDERASRDDAQPTDRKPSWCWQWFGPSHHRMRCRLRAGHEGEHFDHEEWPTMRTVSVATDGRVIQRT